MIYPPAAVTRAHRRDVERRMRQVATVQRKKRGPEPGAGYAGPIIDDGEPVTIRCFYPARVETVGGIRTTLPVDFVLHSHAMLVPRDFRIREGDEVSRIEDPHLREVPVDRKMKVTGVIARATHTYVVMEAIS